MFVSVINARRVCWHTSFLSYSFIHLSFLACFPLVGSFSPIHFFISHFSLFIGWQDVTQERKECKNHICSSLYMKNTLLEAHCDNMRYLKKTGSSFKNHRSAYTPNYIKKRLQGRKGKRYALLKIWGQAVPNAKSSKSRETTRA